MNNRDSEIIYGMMLDRGWQMAETSEEADCVIFNTCSVRAHAEQRAYSNMGMLAELKRRKPSLVLGFVGCTAEKDKAGIFKRLPHVDFIAGPSNIYDIPASVDEALAKKEKVIAVGKRARPEHENPLYHEDPNAVYISISEGCDNFCSYCIVPYVRGRQRSRPKEAILDEIRSAVKMGISEITLIGQNVTSYGSSAYSPSTCDFVGLLEAVSTIEGIERIRFLTCHPKDTKEELFKAMRDIKKIHKHLHLPMQSGSEKILEAMNRGYTPGHYHELVKSLRRYAPDCNITTDIIVGFPRETEKDFKDTYNMMERIEFDSAYIFKYSPRPPAASSKLDDDVPADVKKIRHAGLLRLQKWISAKKSASGRGKTLPMA